MYNSYLIIKKMCSYEQYNYYNKMATKQVNKYYRVNNINNILISGGTIFTMDTKTNRFFVAYIIV